MFEERRDYSYSSYEEFNNAYNILCDQGETLYSPGHFVNRYGITRQALYNWSHRDGKVRQISYSPTGNKHDCFIFMVESDVMEAYKNSQFNKDRSK